MGLGVGIRMARTVDIARMMWRSRYNWLFIELAQRNVLLARPRIAGPLSQSAASGANHAKRKEGAIKPQNIVLFSWL